MQKFNYSLEYIKRRQNVVVGALSRRCNQLHHVSTDIVKKTVVCNHHVCYKRTSQNLKSEYKKDQKFTPIFGPPTNSYQRTENKLYWNDKLCIPEESTERHILQDSHESELGALRGFQKTLDVLKRFFYWPKLKEKLYNYTRNCLSCQQNKSLDTKPPENLRSFPPPTKKWEAVSMDFLFDLSEMK